MKNPTKLEVGYQGVLQGENAEVVGRATIKNSDGYRWDEYYVRLGGKSLIILVYEKGAWKRFEEYDFKPPIEADAADGYGIGDQITMGFRTGQVEYVGHSVVTHVEGEVLEGEHLGSEANYFNATADNEMLVVSWTGQEVEYYMGSTLPRHEVPHAFGIPEVSWLRRLFSGGVMPSGIGTIVGLSLFLVLFGVITVVASRSHGSSTVGPPPVQTVTGNPIPVDATGSLNGKAYTVVSRWKGEIDQVDKRYQRYEYVLSDSDGKESLLVQGEGGSPHTWMLFTDMGELNLTPSDAATYGHTARLPLGGESVVVDVLFLSQTLETAGKPFPDSAPGGKRYGFTGNCPDGAVIVRWDDTRLHGAIGQTVIESDVLTGFPTNAPPPPGK